MNNNHFEKTCQMCGKIFLAKSANAKRCPDCRVIWMKEYKRRWNNSPHGLQIRLQWQRVYRSTPEGKRKEREASKKYYYAHREQRRAYWKEWYKKNGDLYRLNARERYYDKCADYWNGLTS